MGSRLVIRVPAALALVNLAGSGHNGERWFHGEASRMASARAAAWPGSRGSTLVELIGGRAGRLPARSPGGRGRFLGGSFLPACVTRTGTGS